MSDADWYAAEQERIVRATELFKTTEERALAAEARAARYEEALRLVEFGSCDGCGTGGRFCAWCSEEDPMEVVAGEHLPSCPVAAALSRSVPQEEEEGE